MKQIIISVALCALLVWGVLRDREQPPPTPPVEFFALGTLMQINSVEPLPSGLITQLQSTLATFEKRWSVLGDGELAQLNQQLKTATHAPLPEALRSGVQRGQQACLDSNGLFDPGLGNLVSLWGFDDEDSFRSTPPSSQVIADTPMRSLCHAQLGQQVQLQKPGARLNFGASAKGQAVEVMTQTLLDHGLHNFIVNAGGDLKAMGKKPKRAWRIGIRHPRPDENHRLLAKLDVHSGEAVFSSGDYERFFMYEGQRYHHIIDPRTGSPAGNSQSATVIADDALWADAASTALFVAGPSLASQIMQSMQIDLWLLVDRAGKIHTSPAMRARLTDLAAP